LASFAHDARTLIMHSIEENSLHSIEENSLRGARDRSLRAMTCWPRQCPTVQFPYSVVIFNISKSFILEFHEMRFFIGKAGFSNAISENRFTKANDN
jgi:hypothetical protein